MNISTQSIRSRSKRTWSNSRYIDNHYDSKLHSTPFLPCGLNDSKQIVYSDIGLSEVRTNCTKLKNFQDLEQRNVSIKEIMIKQGNWRSFIEFQDKLDEMVVTIEYCIAICKIIYSFFKYNYSFLKMISILIFCFIFQIKIFNF